MSMRLKDLPNDFCLEKCPYRELYLETETLYSDGQECIGMTEVRCKHENLCQAWFDRIPEKKTGRFSLSRICLHLNMKS